MSRRIRSRSLFALALSVMTVLPAVSYAEHEDGAAEKTGEKIDETADEVREGAKERIDKA